jgi:cell wall integrity and stress response component
MPVDPRADFKNIYSQQGNLSQHSFDSLQDNQDYSRAVHEPKKVLRVNNPDPDP